MTFEQFGGPGNYYSGAALDRRGELRGDERWVAAKLADPATRVIPVWRGQVFVRAPAEPGAKFATLSVAQAKAALEDEELLLLGERNGVVYFAVDVSAAAEPAAVPGLAGGAFVGLREVGPSMDRADGALLAYAKGITHWHTRHPYCPACGARTQSRQAGHVRVCTNAACGAQNFPRTDPAVIMLVYKGDSCLLAHNRRNPRPRYSTLAGFVEPGESLEEAVAREVKEEVGLDVVRVRYHSSQPWPFPANLMLGFHAEAGSTEITLDESELVQARWFSRDEIARADELGIPLSPPESISRRLIDDWVRGG